MQWTRSRRTGTARRGGASVELALVAPVLLLLLFGIVELGMIFSTLMQLNHVTREGARVACVGATPYEIYQRMIGASPKIAPEQLTVHMEYRTFSGGYWTTWTTLSGDGTRNDAPPGAQIRLRTEYDHTLVLGGLFGRFADNPETHVKVLKGSAVMRRE